MSRQVLLFTLAALGLFASCLGFAAATILEQPLPTLVNDQKNDSAPMVMVHWIGADFVIFEVAGVDTFHHLPVKSIHVNYSQVPSARSSLWEPSSNSPSQQIHHAKKFTFDRMVNITGLNAGVSYAFEFYLTNTAGEATPSRMVTVLLKPQTPDFSITHQSAGTIRLFWGYPDEKMIDYFLLTVEKVCVLSRCSKKF